MKSFSLSAGQKGIELICQAPDVPGMVVGDPTRLRQVLTNLLGNALKFTAKGEIVVQAEVASQDAEAMAVHFSVRDTGIGISADAAAKRSSSLSRRPIAPPLASTAARAWV